MRAVIQRVLNASVQIENDIVSSIERGMLVFTGLHYTDTEQDMEYIIRKMLHARIFEDENGVMNQSVVDIKGEVLVVPQFTLYGDMRKGRRPSYSDAMKPDMAREFFNNFVDRCILKYKRIQSGIFGADMKVSLVNSGPVTILLDSSKIL